MQAIVGDPEIQQNLEDSLRELPELLRDAQVTLDSARDTFESFERVGNAAEETMGSFRRSAGNIEQFTEPLGRRSEELPYRHHVGPGRIVRRNVEQQ